MNERIRVAFIIDTLDAYAGGTENQLLKLIEGLDRSKVKILLICFRQNPWFEKNAGKLGCSTAVVKIDSFKKLSSFVNTIMLAVTIRKFKPHVVQTFFPVANIIGVLAARLAGVKNIVSSRRDFGEWMNKRYLLATRTANKMVKKIITNSEMVRELTIEKECVSSFKVDVFHNGIDASMFRGLPIDISLKKNLGIPAGDKVIGIIANFRPMKHHHVFLKAANEVFARRKDLSFLLVGDGPLKGEMVALARELGIEKKCHFVGLQTDVRPYLSMIDIGVNCSEGEGLSNAIMEYMCAGIPCIVARAGGNMDLITHGLNGFTYNLDDHHELAALIIKLLEDNSKRQAFSACAMEKMNREMSLNHMLTTHLNFYIKLAND